MGRIDSAGKWSYLGNYLNISGFILVITLVLKYLWGVYYVLKPYIRNCEISNYTIDSYIPQELGDSTFGN